MKPAVFGTIAIFVAIAIIWVGMWASSFFPPSDWQHYAIGYTTLILFCFAATVGMVKLLFGKH